jgi:hypothetical protein
LRAIRRVRQDLRAADCSRDVENALTQAIEALRALDLPHLEEPENARRRRRALRDRAHALSAYGRVR